MSHFEAGFFRPRPDVGAIYGSEFTNSGYEVLLRPPSGRYLLAVFGHSTVTNDFTVAADVRGRRDVRRVTAGCGVAVGDARFAPSGFSLTVGSLASGTYDLAVFAHSSVTGAFNQFRVIRVSVP